VITATGAAFTATLMALDVPVQPPLVTTTV
jgi:hypothetical protein